MTHYRSLTTGDVLSADDVMDCEWCADGMTLDDETCPNCAPGSWKATESPLETTTRRAESWSSKIL